MAQFSASRPARIRVQMGHFLKCDLKDVIILAGTIVLFAVVVIFNWKFALILLGIGLFVGIYSLFEAKKVFMEGDLCPAMVVDADRNLVAVFTDLSKTRDQLPAVKILKQPLSRTAGGPFKNGTRLAFVAMYNGFPNQPRWKSFGGYLANSGTRSKKAIQRVTSEISGEDWQQLQAALAQIPQPFAAGQYEDLEV